MQWKANKDNLPAPCIPTLIWTQGQIDALNFFLQNKSLYRDKLKDTRNRFKITDQDSFNDIQFNLEATTLTLTPTLTLTMDWRVFFYAKGNKNYFIIHCKTEANVSFHLIACVCTCTRIENFNQNQNQNQNQLQLLFKAEDWINHQSPVHDQKSIARIKRYKNFFKKRKEGKEGKSKLNR